MSKINFARNGNGTFDFSEARVARLMTALEDRTTEQGPRVPATLMSAACTDLVRNAHEVADRREIPFHDAMRRVVRERPSLFKLTRGVAVNDGDPTADVEVAA